MLGRPFGSLMPLVEVVRVLDTCAVPLMVGVPVAATFGIVPLMAMMIALSWPRSCQLGFFTCDLFRMDQPGEEDVSSLSLSVASSVTPSPSGLLKTTE